MNGLVLDLRYALRGLRRSPALVGVAVLTLALGVGANTAMFSVVRGVLLRPLPYAEGERLVSLWKEKRWSPEMLRDVRERVRSFEGIAAARSTTYTLLAGDAPPEAVEVAGVSSNYFDVLRVTPALGRGFREGDATAAEGYVALLAYDYWQSRFGGDPAVVGRPLDLAGDGVESRTIVGVLPPGFAPPAGKARAWVPLVTDPALPGYWGSYGMSVVGRLRPGTTVEQASAELRRQADGLTPIHPTQFREARYSPVDVVPLLDTMIGDVRSELLVLMGVVGFILLIAASNVANLLLARAAARQRDVGLQVALGSSNRRIARQVLTESALLGLAGGTVGAGAALLALPLVRASVAEQLPRTDSIALDPAVLLFALAASVLTGLAFGAIPAARAARQPPAGMLRESSRTASPGRRADRVNDALIVVEVALSLVLLAGAGLMLKSLRQLTRVETGFSAENVTTMQIALPPGRYETPEQREVFARALLARLGALGGVESVGTINELPLAGGSTAIPYTVEGEAAAEGEGYQVVNVRIVTPGYFEAMRVPLVKGRMLGDREPEGADAGILVNRAFARQHWPDGEALGRRLRDVEGEPIGTVVGVVADVRQMAVGEEPLPEIYAHPSLVGWGAGFVVARGDGRTSPEALAAAAREVEPGLVVRNARTMREVVRENLGDARFFARLFAGFAGLALVLAAVGVYGVIAFAMSRRVREIGVRMALGATSGAVLRSMLGRALLPVLAGIGVGVAGALAGTRVMAGLLYEVDSADPSVLAAVALLMAGVGMLGALVPTARAVRVDPVVALRGE